MWSTVVMFVLTFAILGLLLGFAEVYNPWEGVKIGSPGEIVVLDENATSAVGSEDNATTTDG